jgi:glucose/arabinose dehydrogenase
MRQVFIACFCLQVILFLVLPLPVDATVPQGFTDTQVGSNLASPTAMAFAPDGRIFVCQQTGQLRVIENGTLLSANFLSLTVDSSGERGLLGIAFDPNFTSNQYVYVYYTVPGNPPHNRVSRFTANGNIAVTGSELIILELDNLTGATNHNGGALHFGLDGKLYVAVGDNATSSNSQTLGNLHGKMLRINTDGTVPNDNPFYGQASGKNRAIWSLGLRNPFTFAVDPDGGEMFINDVGQVTREEINRGIAGANYGWPTCEGPCNPTNANFTDPIYYYTHATSNTQGCAITGGTFYNPSVQQFPTTYVGKYFFADFCNNWINYLDADGPPSANTATVFATALSSPVDLQVGTDGCLYYLQRGAGGQVRKIQYTGSASPVITSHPASLTVSVAQTATFTVQASGAEPLSYQWQRNNVNIAGATAASYTTPATVIGDSGATYRCVVTNSADSATSNNAMLTVTTNLPPIPTISNPTAGTFYTAGQTLNYSGTATDPETGALSASALTWQVDFYHGTHVHPFMPATSGITSGSFTIPAAGETAADVLVVLFNS